MVVEHRQPAPAADRDITIGHRIILLRRQARLTQAELAKAAGITRAVLQCIEAGDTEPRWSTLRGLAAALGVTVNDLIEPVEIPTCIRFRYPLRRE